MASITGDLNFINPLHQASYTAVPKPSHSTFPSCPDTSARPLLQLCATSCFLYHKIPHFPCFQISSKSHSTIHQAALGKFQLCCTTRSGNIKECFLLCQRGLHTQHSEPTHAVHFKLKVSTKYQYGLQENLYCSTRATKPTAKQVLFITNKAGGSFVLFGDLFLLVLH